MYIFFAALFFCVVFVLLLRAFAKPLGLIDHPVGRKQHAQPTPTVGGVAMFLALAVALYIFEGYVGSVPLLVTCAGLLVLLGVLDDKYDLPVGLRLMMQVTLALLVIMGAGGTITHLGSLFGVGDVHLGLIAVPFSLIAFVGGINAMNMIDGADGMAGKMALITVAGVGAIFYLSGASQLLPLVWGMLGVLLGFLLFNARIFVKQAWIFMGDAGSMWLGLVLGWFMAQITQDTVAAEPALVFWLFGLPLIDTLQVMFARIKRKRSPFHADRTHAHHIFQDVGFPVKKAVAFLSLFQLVMVGMGVLLYWLRAPAAFVFWGFVAVYGFVYLYRMKHQTVF